MARRAPSKLAALTLSVVAVASAACAGARAERDRQDALVRELDGLRYEQPLDDTWPQVVRLLAEQGYPLAGSDAKAVGQPLHLYQRIVSRARETEEDRGTRVLETDWRAGVRYRVEGKPDTGGSRIAFTKIHEDLTEHGRDAGREPGVEMGLAFARRVAPEQAARIEATAGSGAPGEQR